jgi:hypothetical protein
MADQAYCIEGTGAGRALGTGCDASRVSPRSARSAHVAVCVEATGKRAFASALDWPGWCRAGRDEAAALAALRDYSGRYAPVAKEAGVPFVAGEGFTVTERSAGSAMTDFGVPCMPAAVEHDPLTAAAARRMAKLVGATWAVFDRVVAGAPPTLRKGPRGGGRDRDAIVEHVLGAEREYARKLGIRVAQPRLGETGEIAAMREAIALALGASRRGAPRVDRGWLPRYAARRIAWHVLDHAWEIEDRSER